VVFVGLVAVLGLLQPYALLILPVLVLTSLVVPSGDRRHEVLLTGLCAGAGIVLTVPHLLLVANRAVGQPDPPPVTAANLAEELLRLPVGMLSPRLAGIAAAVMLTLLTVGVVVCWRRPPSGALHLLRGPARRAHRVGRRTHGGTGRGSRPAHQRRGSRTHPVRHRLRRRRQVRAGRTCG
jgi:hypothetical protein